MNAGDAPAGTADMFDGAGGDPRTDPPGRAGETATLLGFLRWQRHTFELKCAGLAPELLAARAVPPSPMSLLGMVRHLSDVERVWFRVRFGAEDVAPRYWSDADPDADWHDAAPERACVDEAWRAWHEEVAYGERFVSNAPDLDLVMPAHREALSLRWLLVHLIEEYARHNGHADLLRERLDGRVGE